MSVLVEGFKSGPFRKIEVFNDTLYQRPSLHGNIHQRIISPSSATRPVMPAFRISCSMRSPNCAPSSEEKTGLTGNQVKTA
ncbi:MAG: hypothetical protein MZV70_42490 [Desulfobacterales bacterium]|nr:hypothetical protein [Desulfobacterales bacterium]